MMFLSNALNDDVRTIITEGLNGEYTSHDRAHRLYVRLVHARRWDGTTAKAVYWAWQPVISKASQAYDDDIPF